MSGLAMTPASNYLFNTYPGCTKLGEEKGQLFHHLVAKLLYLCKCTRQDMIQTLMTTKIDQGDAIHTKYKKHNINN